MIREAVVRQFRKPEGVAGRLVGWVMARRPSNRARNRRTIDLLEIQPADRVLEIGFGPGLALGWAAERATQGTVVGIDHSELMVREASRRNGRAVREGRMRLYAGSVEALPGNEGPFDRVFAVNVALFWPDVAAVARRVAAVMRPGGRLALTFQPRQAKATNEAARRGGERLAESLCTAGFEDVRVHVLPMKPVDAVCVMGETPR